MSEGKNKFLLGENILLSILLMPFICNAQSVDTSFADNLDAFCQNIGDPLFCLQALPGETAPGVTAPTTANIGVLGSQGRSSNLTAYQQKKGVRRRLDTLENKTTEVQGGGASSDYSFGSFGTFLTLQHADTDRQASTLENGYLSELNGVFGGLDYRFMDNLFAGISVGYSNTNANFNNQAGGLDTASLNTTTYAAYNPTKNTTIDGYFGYATLKYDSARKVNFGRFNDTAKGSTNGDQYLAGLSASYGWSYTEWSLNPQIKLDYSNTYIQNLTESGSRLSSIYGTQNIKSLRTSFGSNISYSASVPWGALLPHAHAFYVHEFKDDSRNISISLATLPSFGFSYATDRPDRDFFTWGGGISTVMAHGIQMFVDYEQLSGNFLYNIWTVSAGLRAEF